MKHIYITLGLMAIAIFSIGQSCPSNYNTTISLPNLRQWNPTWTYSILFDEFENSSLNSQIWGVRTGCVRNVGEEAQHYKSSPNNISISNGTLKLTARKETTYDWVYPPIGDRYWGLRNYTSGEIYTKEKTFDYGEYTIRCRFPVGSGSWAAFWVYGAPSGQANEIDFFEQNKREGKNGAEINNVFHWYYSGGTCGPMFDNFPANVNDWHIYRCRWTPYETKFYIDNMDTPVQKWSRYETLSFQYVDINQIREGTTYKCNANYPIYPGEVIINYALKSGNGVVIDDTKLPQSFEIDYIKIKKFFLAPEITCPNVICSSGTATMDVDIAATNISWALTPANIFSGATTGTGTNVNIVRASGSNGQGKITYTFQMPSGETFTTEKEFWVGLPIVYSYGNHLVVPDTSTPITSLCMNKRNDCQAVHPAGYAYIDQWEWRIIGGGNISLYGYPTYQYASVYPSTSSSRVEIRAHNACGWTGWASMYAPVISCYTYSLLISPNPSTEESTISLLSDNNDEADKLTADWDYEIYDSFQGLKEKKTKLKTKETKINTSGWKDGIYIVRATIDGQTITEKMLVKH